MDQKSSMKENDKTSKSVNLNCRLNKSPLCLNRLAKIVYLNDNILNAKIPNATIPNANIPNCINNNNRIAVNLMLVLCSIMLVLCSNAN